jgi:hypothetical protein
VLDLSHGNGNGICGDRRYLARQALRTGKYAQLKTLSFLKSRRNFAQAHVKVGFEVRLQVSAPMVSMCMPSGKAPPKCSKTYLI